LKRKLIWIIPACLMILASMALPWYKLNVQNTNQESQIVRSSFFQTYGQTAKINNFVKPEDIRIYGAYWQDEKYIHTSLCFNGVWVEIARQEIVKIQPTPAP
jgi:hypothetical protein